MVHVASVMQLLVPTTHQPQQRGPQLSVSKRKEQLTQRSSAIMDSADLRAVPRAFSLYWGFGDPLEVLDDGALLTRMAVLRQHARDSSVQLSSKQLADLQVTVTRTLKEHLTGSQRQKPVRVRR